MEIQLGPLTRSIAIRQESLDVKRRTVDLIFSAGSPVMRYDFWNGQRYVETLSLEAGAVRLGRLNNGAPLLNAHSSWSLTDVLGVVVEGSARIVDGEGVATVRFPEGDPDVDRVWNKVRQGIVRNVSVGYEVHKYEKTEAEKGKSAELRAVDWEPYEISLVPMGADDLAKVRSAKKADIAPIPVIARRSAGPPSIPVTKKESRAMAKPNAALQLRESVEPNEDGTCPDGYELVDGMCQLRQAAEPTERALGAEAEKERISGILRAAAALGLSAGSELVQRLIKDGTALVSAQDAIIEWHKSRVADDKGPRPGIRGVTVEHDVLDTMYRGMTGALLHRINPEKHKLPDEARQYRSRSLLQLAELCLAARGVRAIELAPMELARRAFEPMNIQVRAGYSTTSDFANILADTSGKILRQMYEELVPTWGPIARRIEIRDFKPVKALQLGEAPGLEKVLEHGEFKRGTIAESKEEFSLATYGKIFGLTRQALINDDLNAFGRVPEEFARAARRLEADLVWFNIIYGKTATMADGNALFSAAHANFTDSGAAIAVDKLGNGRALMAKQTGLDGASYLNLKARYLMVPPDLETIAQQYTTVVQGQQVLTPGQPSSVNPFAGMLQVISEPRLGGSVTVDGVTATGDAFQWYLAASPDQIDIVLYGYLAGSEGPFLESRVGFDVDGFEQKVRLDFVAKVVDHRGLYRNDGQ